MQLTREVRALDGSFGTAGSALAPLDGYYRYAQLAAQPDGRLLVAWAIGKSQAVVRFDANSSTHAQAAAPLTAFEGDNSRKRGDSRSSRTAAFSSPHT